MGFAKRTTAPSASDKNWIHTSKGGKNSCIPISGNSVLPNCVGYAWGRFMEILGRTPKLSRNNAEDWWAYNDGYARGQAPKLGAVACWRKGKAGTGTDGAGHVAIVEEIYSDGSFLTSNSAYKGTRFYTQKIGANKALSGYTFQGFIYNPAVSAEGSRGNYNVGEEYEITVSAGLKVRTGPGTSYAQKKRSALTADGQKNAASGNMAVLKKGTDVTCMVVKTSGSYVWMQIPSGWICAEENGTAYVKATGKTYTAGQEYTVTVKSGVKVRKGPGTNYTQKKKSELTDDGQKNAASGNMAVLKKGTNVTCLAVKSTGGETWLQIPSGWVCAVEDGEVYVE